MLVIAESKAITLKSILADLDGDTGDELELAGSEPKSDNYDEIKLEMRAFFMAWGNGI